MPINAKVKNSTIVSLKGIPDEVLANNDVQSILQSGEYWSGQMSSLEIVLARLLHTDFRISLNFEQ